MQSSQASHGFMHDGTGSHGWHIVGADPDRGSFCAPTAPGAGAGGADLARLSDIEEQRRARTRAEELRRAAGGSRRPSGVASRSEPVGRTGQRGARYDCAAQRAPNMTRIWRVPAGEHVALTIGESPARLGVRRAEPSQHSDLANATLAVEAREVGSEVPARLVRGGPVERRRGEDPAAASDARAGGQALLAGGALLVADGGVDAIGPAPRSLR
jgi:hypothetical protein